MTTIGTVLHQPRLRTLLFLLLLISGIVPLAISSFFLIRQNRGVLETQEMSTLTSSAEVLSVELNGSLTMVHDSLAQLAETILLAPTPSGVAGVATVEDRLRQSWIEERVSRFMAAAPTFLAVRLLAANGVGPQYTARPLASEAVESLQRSFIRAVAGGESVYGLLALDLEAPPAAILTVPVLNVGGGDLYAQAIVRIEAIETFVGGEAQGDVQVFLLDHEGDVLWSVGAGAAMERAVATSTEVRKAAQMPWTQTARYTLQVDGRSRQLLARVSPVPQASWNVVVQKPASSAFAAVREMIFNTALSTALLVALSLLVAGVVAQRFSRPIKELTDSSHEIAAGNFGKRVAVTGPGAEIGQLAADFNRMSVHVESHVEQLRQAARANQELFIGSMRAFVAAIDAKDPYTRGHSERVAAHSRTIAKRLGLGTESEHRLWVGALLHDVGKIGIEDRILKKGGILTDEEYEQMKLHPVIGAQIMSRIEQLKEMLPAIRWHHEAWGGGGYPDGITGENIPLDARIVAVADTFDAITTNRPYQRAYEPTFAVEKIRELAGKRFDAKVVSAFLMAFEAGEIQLRKPTAVAEPTADSAGAVTPA